MLFIKPDCPKHQCISSYKKQSGLVLVVSLILMASITILGTATMSGTWLNERIAANSQQKFLSFQIAESTVETVWQAQLLRDTAISGASDILNTPDAVPISQDITGILTDYDLDTAGGGRVEVGGTVTAQYCGEMAAVSGSLNADESTPQLVGMLIDVTSDAQIDNTFARTITVKRGSVTAIATGRTANCPAP